MELAPGFNVVARPSPTVRAEGHRCRKGRWRMLASPQREDQKQSTPGFVAPNPLTTVHFYDFEGFRLDVRRRRLLLQGQPVPITPKALELLLILVERRGRVVEKDDLVRLLWPDTIVEEANLTQSVFIARKALGEAPGENRFIATAARQGYRFVADVKEVEEAPAIPLASSRTPTPSERAVTDTKPFWTRGRRIAAGVALAGAILVGLVALLVQRSGVAPSDPIRSLAVLPLRSMSASIDDQHFADGLTDALIADLATVSALRVVSRQSVMRYKESLSSLPQISSELGVDALIEGSVARSGGRLRLTAQLVHGPSDRHLWAASFDRDLKDALKLQGELARSVAHEVNITLTEQEAALLSKRREVDPEAYALYLRGRHFWDRRSQETMLKSIEYFEQAIGKDPMLAEAYAGIALAYLPLGYFGHVSPADSRTRSQAAAARALELAPGLPDAQVARAASRHVHDWDWEGAEKAWKGLLLKSPNNATAHLWYGLLLQTLGRTDEAISERLRALELDPLSIIVHIGLGNTLSLKGGHDRPIELFQRALELEPSNANALRSLGWAHFMKRMRTQGIAELEKAAEISAGDPYITSWLGHAYALAGRPESARRVLRAMKERARERYVSPFFVACIAAGLGERDNAFAELDDAFRQHSQILTDAKLHPLLAPLHDDPRFTALLRRMNLE